MRPLAQNPPARDAPRAPPFRLGRVTAQEVPFGQGVASITGRERLFGWSKLLVGEFLGTTTEEDPRFHYLRHLEDRTLALRAEVSALYFLLADHLKVPPETIRAVVDRECAALSDTLQGEHPGVEVTEHGLSFDVRRRREIQRWMGKWPK